MSEIPDAVWCEDCEHQHPDRGGHPRYWMCLKHKRTQSFGFVTRTKWDKFAPYLYCSDVNDGLCPLFERKKA